MLLFSLSVHETAHAWTASRLGDQTARMLGRISLNPKDHIDPIGTLLIPAIAIFGPLIGWGFLGPYIFGWAKPVPIMSRNFRNFRRDDMLVSLAGPASNLALAILAGLLIRVGYEWHFFSAPHAIATSRLAIGPNGGAMDLLAQVLSIFLSLNLLLCAFNLLPVPPLDGSKAPLLLLPASMAEKYDAALSSPILRYAGIILASRLIPPILPKLLIGAASVIYPTVHYF